MTDAAIFETSARPRAESVARMTVAALHRMKRERRKIVGVIAWDYPIACILDGVGVDVVAVGGSVGADLWGHRNARAVTMDQMVAVAQGVRRGVIRALVCVDLPWGPLQEGPEAALRAAIRFVKEAGADMVRLDGAAQFPEAVEAIARAGVPVVAQFGDAAAAPGASAGEARADRMIAEARLLESAGAAVLDCTGSGAETGPRIVHAVGVPVLGGAGGGPWLDGRLLMAHDLIGYGAGRAEAETASYANVARVARDALADFASDVRAGLPVRGAVAGT